MRQPFAIEENARPGSAAELPRWTAVWETLRRALGLRREPRVRWIVGRTVEVARDEILVHDLDGRSHCFPRAGVRDVAFVGRRDGATADLWIWYSPRGGRSSYETVYAGTFDVESHARRRTERRLMKLGLMMDGF